MIVAVGGLAGSGTRLVPLLLSQVGFDFGKTNYALDALEFRSFYAKHLTEKHSDKQKIDDLTICIQKHLRTIKQFANWGWKNPLSIYFLREIDQAMPLVSYIHVIRDGNMMTTSTNQAVLEGFGEYLIGTNKVTEKNSLKLWEKTNLEAADYGENQMKNRYLRVKFEDILSGKGITRLLDFTNTSSKLAGELQESIKPITRSERTNFHSPALERFGYSQ